MINKSETVNENYEQGVKDAIAVLCKNSAGVFLGEFYENQIEDKYRDTDVAKIMCSLARDIRRIVPEYILGTGHTNIVLNAKLLSVREKEKLKLFEEKLNAKIEEEILESDKLELMEPEERKKYVRQKDEETIREHNEDSEKRRVVQEEFDRIKKKYDSIFGGETFAFYAD